MRKFEIKGPERGHSVVLSADQVREMQRSAARQEELAKRKARNELARRKKEWLGEFDTELPCVCGATIIDHAAETRIRGARPVRLGPQPTPEDLLRSFSITHRYFCGGCGVMYKGSVLVEKRGYVPREKRT